MLRTSRMREREEHANSPEKRKTGAAGGEGTFRPPEWLKSPSRLKGPESRPLPPEPAVGNRTPSRNPRVTAAAREANGPWVEVSH